MNSRHGPFTTQVDEITEEEWNSLLDGFADASIYQTWAYGAVSWGEGQLSHLVLRREGCPVALAQVRIVRVPVLGSGIAYVRWGPICKPRSSSFNSDAWRATNEALVQEYAGRRRLVLRVIPNTFVQDAETGAMANIYRELGLQEEASVRKYHTFRVNLRHSVEELRRRLSSRWRRQLNISERNNLEIVKGQTNDLYIQFLALYRQMFARKRFETTVDVEEFRRIQERLPASHKMMTLICLSGGRPVAGLVVSGVGLTSIYLLAATGDDGLRARGSYLLQWHAMQWLKERGYEWYDLGGVNQELNPGVFTFKSGMGGEEACQLGRHHAGGSPFSRVTVSIGESAKRVLQRVTWSSRL